MTFEYVEKLSLHEQFRLVEIAHETNSYEIREAAMKVLHKYLNPLVTFTSCDLCDLRTKPPNCAVPGCPKPDAPVNGRG